MTVANEKRVIEKREGKPLDNPYFQRYIRNITDDGYCMGNYHKSLFNEQFRFSMSNLSFRNIFTFENKRKIIKVRMPLSGISIFAIINIKIVSL